MVMMTMTFVGPGLLARRLEVMKPQTGWYRNSRFISALMRAFRAG